MGYKAAYITKICYPDDKCLLHDFDKLFTKRAQNVEKGHDAGKKGHGTREIVHHRKVARGNAVWYCHSLPIHVIHLSRSG